MKIRVAIADDHPMVVNGIRDMLSDCSHISIVATYTDGNMLINELTADTADVLLLDIQLPGKRGDELAPVILKNFPELRILALTSMNNMLYINNMLQNGVLGYLLKNTDQETLTEAIETVYSRRQYLTPAMEEKLTQFRQQLKRKTSAKFSLTPRETDILKLVVQEYTSAEIAEKLNLSLRTIENYRLHLSIKLEVKNTVGLVRRALELGIATL